ncbi:MAG TPA: hypothetical protein VIW03_15420 [Anaeromyxobacter sp.]
MRTSRRVAALACAAAVSAPALAGAQAVPGEWRTARWGMTLDEVLKAFPGEAARLVPPEKLADGNVVAAGIEGHTVGANPFRVRFVFEPDGKLALVSLRTDPRTYAGPDAFQATRTALLAQLGPPEAETADGAFIDMRQVTWKSARGRVDLKYIPGVVVILHAAPSQKPVGPQAVRTEPLEPQAPPADRGAPSAR